MRGDSNLITKKVKRYSSISLVEGLLVGIGLVIVAVVAILYFNPFGKVSQDRNEERTADLTNIADALVAYSRENEGTLPEGIPVSNQCTADSNRICASGVEDCGGKVDLSALTREKKHLEILPKDPQEKSSDSTGYNIVQNESGRVTLCAPQAELDKEISVSI